MAIAGARRFVDRVRRSSAEMIRGRAGLPPDFDADARDLVGQVSEATMTSPERIVALRDALRHVVHRQIPGAVVECGVWRGGSMMAAAHTLTACGDQRPLYLFDTFGGMTAPGDDDVDVSGRSAAERMRREDPEVSMTWAKSGLETVQRNMRSTGYPEHLVHYVVGPVEETIPREAPAEIAVLRLDTDWYASTKHELDHLWDRVPSGGVVIIDDYGHWEGARRAVDEFLAAQEAPPLLLRIDYTGRQLIKGS